MLEAFSKHIEVNYPMLRERSSLIACSGGVDSVVLVHLCSSLGLDFSLAHCNFGLRGPESDADEEFVKTLGKELSRPCYSKHFDTLGYVNSHKVSVQMAARELRYQWFGHLLNKYQLAFLLTAHHADDSLETFLINLSRGTGLSGLTGIPARAGSLLRPLLPFSRKEIMDYARSNNISWREDSSNEETKYLRNKIRQELVPVLRELHPAFLGNFLKTQDHLTGSSLLLEDYKKMLRKQYFEKIDSFYRIAVEPLHVLEPLDDYMYLLFSEYGFVQGGEVAGLLNAGSGKYLISSSHRLIKDRKHLLLQKLEENQQIAYVIPIAPGKWEGAVTLHFEEVDQMGEMSKQILYVDKETLNPVLILRKWQKGDYFYPLGMKGSKKVSKFFKDGKLSMIAKEQQWLLCSGDHIVWVVGLRADERFKVTEATKTIMKVTLLA